jgi:hypothetical protein
MNQKNSLSVAKEIKDFCEPPSLKSFVKENKERINACIKRCVPDLSRPNSTDRINWVLRTQYISGNCGDCDICKHKPTLRTR